MAETTLTAILTRFSAVLEAAPLSLVPTADAFSHDRQPTGLADNTYFVDDGGLVSSRPVGNYKAVRIDKLTVLVALKINRDGHARKKVMETTLLTIERYIKADGPANGYHAEFAGGRRVTHPRGSELLIGSIAFTVDYDVNEATS